MSKHKGPDIAALKKLAEHLRSIPKRGFTQEVWSRTVNHEFISKKHIKAGFSCGMAACIGGHAAALFPRRLWIDGFGLHYEGERGFWSSSTAAFEHAFRTNDLGLDTWDTLLDSAAPHQTPKAAARAVLNYAKRAEKAWKVLTAA